MRRLRLFALSVMLFVCSGDLWSQECCLANQFYIGPTVYHVERERKGGTHQCGELGGVRLGYDRIGRNKFYLGFEFLYARGHLGGHGGTGKRIKSTFIDMDIEGRFGYTLQQKCAPRLAFTPFVGGGYAQENNNFRHPSPIPVHFRLHYIYWSAGFLSQISITPRFDAGINFTAKFMIEGKNKATHDPKCDDSVSMIGNRNHYKIEVPLSYHYGNQTFISLVPFYEYRLYGHHAGYPFDFLDTKLNLYGITLKWVYCL